MSRAATRVPDEGRIVAEMPFGHLWLRLRRMPGGSLFWALVHDAGSTEVGIASGPCDARLADDLKAMRQAVSQQLGAQ